MKDFFGDQIQNVYYEVSIDLNGIGTVLNRLEHLYSFLGNYWKVPCIDTFDNYTDADFVFVMVIHKNKIDKLISLVKNKWRVSIQMKKL